MDLGLNLGFSSCLAFVSAEPEFVVSELAADADTTSTINRGMLNTCPIVTNPDTDEQTVAWYRGTGNAVRIARRTLPSGAWTVESGSSLNGNVNDSHNFLSLGIAADGVLHVNYDQHASPIKYKRLANSSTLLIASPLATLPLVAGRSTQEDLSTYPDFRRMASGNLLYFWRTGGSGNGDVVLYKVATGTGTITSVHNVLLSGISEGVSPYFSRPYVEDATEPHPNRIHLWWIYRDTTDASTAHDPCYGYSDDEGVTWRAADGVAYTVPITQAAATAKRIAAITTTSGLASIGSGCIDATGNPVFLVKCATNSSGVQQTVAQFHLFRWNGSAWTRRVLHGERLPFRIGESNDGTAGNFNQFDTSYGSPILFDAATGMAHLIYMSASRGAPGIYCTSSDDWFVTQSTREINDAQHGYWECCHDSTAWQKFKRVYMLLQDVTNGPTDAPISVAKFLPPDEMGTDDVDPKSLLYDPTAVSGCAYYSTASVFHSFVNACTTNDGGANSRLITGYDQRSGSSRALSNASTANRPRWDRVVFNGSAAWQFIAANTVYATCDEVGALLAGTGVPFTIVIALKFTVALPATANTAIWSLGRNSANGWCFLGIGADGTSLNATATQDSSSTQTARNSGAGTIAAQGDYVLTVVYDGTNVLIRRNGTQVLAPISWNNGARTLDRFTIGAFRRNSINSYSNQNVYGLFVSTAALSGATLLGVEQGMGAECGITVP